MTTLHDLLKGTAPEQPQDKTPRVDLRGNYSKLGLSAVAASARYGSKADDCKTEKSHRAYPAYWPTRS